jgi:xylan 1,4-beta-xylosidase
MSQITQETRNNVTAIYGSSMPLYYSEFNDGLGSNPPYHDTPYASAFLFKNMYDINGIVDIMSWWTFSDIFEEPGFLSQPFGAVTQWGLLNIYGIPKPSYRAFQLLHGAGDTLLAVSPSVDYYPTVGVWATLGKHKELQVWAYNTNLPGAPINNETLCITLSDIEAKHVEITRIDSSHGNAPQLWYEMGQPMYPTDKQNQEMYEASKIHAEKLAPVFVGNGVTVISFSLEPQGVAFISVK